MSVTIQIRVDSDDVDRMMNSVKKKFLEEHPEMEGLNLSRRFMFKKIVDHALGVEY